MMSIDHNEDLAPEVHPAEQKAKRVRNKMVYGAVAGVTAVAVLGTAVWVAQSHRGHPVYDTGSGLTLTNATQVLGNAEKAYSAFVTSTKAVTLPKPRPLCYLVTASQRGTLLPLIACGPSRAVGQVSGAYDVTDLALATSDGGKGVTGTAGTRFIAHGVIPAGAVLSRPDGQQPLDPSMLDLRPDGSHPVIPAGAVDKNGVVRGADANAAPATSWGAAGRTLAIYQQGVTVVEAGQASTVTIGGTQYVPGPGQVITIVKTIPGGIPGGTDGNTPAAGDGASITVNGSPVVPLAGGSQTTVLVTDARAQVGLSVREGQDSVAVRDLSAWSVTSPDSSGVSVGWLPGYYALRGSGAVLRSHVAHAMFYDLTVGAYRLQAAGGDSLTMTLYITDETWLSAGASVNADAVGAGHGGSDHSKDLLYADGKSLGAPHAEYFTDADGNRHVKTLTWTIPAGTREVLYAPAPIVTFDVLDVVTSARSTVSFDADVSQLGRVRLQPVTGAWSQADAGAAS